jgi:hypothetical protein
MNSKTLAFSLAATLISWSLAATATPIVFTSSSSLVGGVLYGGTYRGDFGVPISFLLHHYQINSAKVVYNFTDDQILREAKVRTAETATAYHNIDWSYDGYNIHETELRDVTDHFTVTKTIGDAGGVNVSLNNNLIGFATLFSTRSTTISTVYDRRVEEGTTGNTFYCGDRDCSYRIPGDLIEHFADIYNETTTNTTDWSRSFALSRNLGGEWLEQQFAKPYSLYWDLTVTGSIKLTSASLYLDVDSVEPPASNIPEPSTALLMLLGLLGLAGTKRRGRSIK